LKTSNYIILITKYTLHIVYNYTALCFNINPVTDEQLFYAPQNITSLTVSFTFYSLLRMQNDLHTGWSFCILNKLGRIESELKWQTGFGTVRSKFSCSSVKGSNYFGSASKICWLFQFNYYKPKQHAWLQALKAESVTFEILIAWLREVKQKIID